MPSSNGHKVLVTGARGFVGRAVREVLAARHIPYRLSTTRPPAGPDLDVTVRVGTLDEHTDWTAAVDDVTSVVHCAARVHIMHEKASDPLLEFRKVNTHGTERLARAAAAAGVRRFVFVSSVKVNGEATHDRPFSPSDPANPLDPYGISKWEAELALTRVAKETGLEVVVVRPTLVYGPGVGGNFLRLLKLARLGVPLPFGAARNLRSLVFVRNLAHLLVTCAEHPRAVGKVFLASDGEDLSTAELCRRLAVSLGRAPRLLPVPLRILRPLASLARRRAEYDRLFGSLQVDSTAARDHLGWTPPYSVDCGLRETATWFQAC